MTTQAAPSDAVQALVGSGRVSAEQVAEAERIGREQLIPTLQVLINQKIVTQADVIRTGAEAVGLEFVELADYVVDGGAVTRLPGEQAKRHNVMPLGWENGKLVIAVSIKQAQDLVLKDDLQRLTRSSIQFVVAMKGDITTKINNTYRDSDQLDDLTAGITNVDDDVSDDLSSLGEVTEDAPIVRFVNLLITQAISDRASDIHIEPTEHELKVRYRVDGVLHEAHKSPKSVQNGVISRLKIMADINIAEKRIPQDGRLSVMHNGKKVDLRVASLPTVWGEKIVMRILDNSNTRMGLQDLGFTESNYDRFAESYVKPYGMILVTGPTGSGKSTTLYATLNQIAKPTVNVITVEDPVEYRIPGINQVQVNQKAGMTFAAALRSILRCDPDVILIGEIRDQETAHIAVEAALTGHMVLSTLHTNDAPSAVTRLTEMDIEPFLVGSAVDAVLAQRLARKLCDKCKEPYTPEKEELIQVRFPFDPNEPLPTLYRPVGCNACSKVGYKGRLALHEVMTVTEDIERLAAKRASAEEIGVVAKDQGMKTLRDDGMHKVGIGKTSIEEILRVVV